LRSFEQRIAEINRRSEGIIKRRKRIRRCILACCVPLVLCIGLWAAIPRCNAPFDSAHSADGTKNENLSESMGTTPYIEVSAQSDYCLYDALTVNKILTILNTSGVKTEAKPDQTQYTQYAAGQITVGANGTEVQEMRIVVKGSDGTRTVYTLMGARLTNEETQDVSYIPSEDLRELHELLGLTEAGED
jgi:hypothetical protein